MRIFHLSLDDIDKKLFPVKLLNISQDHMTKTKVEMAPIRGEKLSLLFHFLYGAPFASSN